MHTHMHTLQKQQNKKSYMPFISGCFSFILWLYVCSYVCFLAEKVCYGISAPLEIATVKSCMRRAETKTKLFVKKVVKGGM